MARGATLRALIDGVPGEWQTRAIGDAFTAEERHDFERVRAFLQDQAAKVDVYQYTDHVLVFVVPSEMENKEPTDRTFRNAS